MSNEPFVIPLAGGTRETVAAITPATSGTFIQKTIPQLKCSSRYATGYGARSRFPVRRLQTRFLSPGLSIVRGEHRDDKLTASPA